MKNLTNNKISKLLKEEVKASKDAVSTNWRETLKGNITLESFTSWLMFEINEEYRCLTFAANTLKKSRRKNLKKIIDLSAEINAQISISGLLVQDATLRLDSYEYRKLTQELIYNIRKLAIEIWNCAKDGYKL